MRADPNPSSDRFWRTDWFAALVLAGLLLALHAATDLFSRLERRLYDAVATARGDAPSERVALIGIDTRSLAQLGRWPWPRDLPAQLVDQLAAAKAAAVVLAIPLAEPETDRGLSYVRRIKEALPPAAAADPELARTVAEAERSLDGDALLAASLGAAGNVLLPAVPAFLPAPAAAQPAAPRYLRRSMVAKPEGLAPPAGRGQLPVARLAEAAAGIGHLAHAPDPDGVLRAVPLLVQDQGGTMPSLALLAAVRGLGLTARDIRAVPGEGLQAGGLRIPTDAAGRVRLALQPARGGRTVLQEDSFVDVLGGAVPAARYAGKIVVVGLTAEGVAERWRTPGGAMDTPELVARTTAGLLGGRFIRQPGWGAGLQLAAFAAVAALLAFGLPRLRTGAAVAASAGLAVTLLALAAGLLAGPGLWVPLVAPAAVLLLGHAAWAIRARALPRGGAAPASVAADGGAPATLGRYALEGELGRGAMGVVYQGRDPRIGRLVAIKTLALGEEFEAEAVDEARQRFFREAETAGRLQHPYIVTIFDVGEERGLAYIAMEFLHGHDLLAHCRADRLLPAGQVVAIAVRVAEALDHAHRQNVVHRDIKPANIMYAADTDTVKVTDFGIARITDSSRTRTGVALGTPSFMSPEQLAGRKVDGRSDIYSLGVTLYQLLTGVLPFRADSLAELMYRITNDPPADLRQHRPDLPAPLVEVVLRALSKRPEDRFQQGRELAAALRASLAAGAQAPAPAAHASAPDDGAGPAAPSLKTASGAPVPDYDATQELSPELLEAYAKTIAIHRPPDPSHAADPPDLTSQSPDRR